MYLRPEEPSRNRRSIHESRKRLSVVNQSEANAFHTHPNTTLIAKKSLSIDKSVSAKRFIGQFKAKLRNRVLETNASNPNLLTWTENNKRSTRRKRSFDWIPTSDHNSVFHKPDTRDDFYDIQINFLKSEVVDFYIGNR